jgi:hypothetical protein
VAGGHDCSDVSPVELPALPACDAVSIESCVDAAEPSACVATSVAPAVGAAGAADAGLPHSQPSVLESTDLTAPNTPRGCDEAAADGDEDEDADDEDEAPADGLAAVSRRTYG